MFIPSATSLALPTATLVDTVPDMAVNNTTTSSTTDETNNTSISTDNSTNTSGMNALSMFLFWFFIVSTVFLVLGSRAVLRRLKRRDASRIQQQQARKAVLAAKGFFGSDAPAVPAPATATKYDDESAGASTVSLLPMARTRAE